MKETVKVRNRITPMLACVLLLGPAVSLAADRALDVPALGVAESLLKYCSKVDASSNAKLQERVALLTGRASPQEIEAARKTEDYRNGYESFVNFSAKLDERNAKLMCSDNAPAGK